MTGRATAGVFFNLTCTQQPVSCTKMYCVGAQNISAGCTITKILNFLYDYYTGDHDGPTAPLEAASLAQASDDFVPGILQGLLQRVGQRVDGTNRRWSYTQRRKTNAASANLQSTLLVCVHSGYCDFVSSFVTLGQKRKRMMFLAMLGPSGHIQHL